MKQQQSQGWVYAPHSKLQEWLMTNHKTQRWLARKTKRPVEQVNRLVRGHIQMTERWAIELEKAGILTAAYWVKEEAQYRLGLAKGWREV